MNNCFEINRSFIYFTFGIKKETLMVKRYILIILPLSLIIAALALSTACSCNCGKKNTIRGYITVIGNEPFTKLAVRTDEDKTFVLQLSKELKEELLKKQGGYYYIQYGDSKEEAGYSIIIVEKVVPINKTEK